MYIPLFSLKPIHFCECCNPRYVEMTATATTHKWTRKEIETEILDISIDLSKKKWYESKSYLEDRLKHWCEKLERIKSLKEEFIITK